MADTHGEQANEPAETGESAHRQQGSPSSESEGRDSEFGIRFRLELSKLLQALAAALGTMMVGSEADPSREPATPEDPDARQHRQPSIESVHRDVEFGIRFRLELSKTLLTLSAALFAFTIAFPPTIKPGTDLTLLGWGWGGLCISMAGGFVNLYGWERFYLTYRDFDWRGEGEKGMEQRKSTTTWRRIGRVCQFAGFVIGTFTIGLFTI